MTPFFGNLDRLKLIYGNLSKMLYACIQICTEEPDYSDLPELSHYWSHYVYGEVTVFIPYASEPLGKYVTLTHYIDAHLMHDVVAGRSVTGVLHMAKKTPIGYF
jgi:hypothetical protein